MNIIFGSKIHVSGDEINGEETSILIVNHRTRVDWNFLWALMYYASIPRCHKMKIALKAELRHMPSLGKYFTVTFKLLKKIVIMKKILIMKKGSNDIVTLPKFF